jgi:hypothetical protein
MRPDDKSTSDPAFLRTDARQRRNLALLMTAMVLFAVSFFFFGLPRLTAWVHAGNTAAVLHKLDVVCDVLAALLLLTAAWATGYARRVLRSDQFPPPGTWVLRDTPLRRGTAARMRAWGLMVVAACCALFAIYAVALPYRLHHRLLPPVPTNGAPLQPIR